MGAERAGEEKREAKMGGVGNRQSFVLFLELLKMFPEGHGNTELLLNQGYGVFL